MKWFNDVDDIHIKWPVDRGCEHQVPSPLAVSSKKHLTVDRSRRVTEMLTKVLPGSSVLRLLLLSCLGMVATGKSILNIVVTLLTYTVRVAPRRSPTRLTTECDLLALYRNLDHA